MQRLFGIPETLVAVGDVEIGRRMGSGFQRHEPQVDQNLTQPVTGTFLLPQRQVELTFIEQPRLDRSFVEVLVRAFVMNVERRLA